MKKITFLLFFLASIVHSQTPLGIDVSHHQGTINWNLVANDGKVFAFVKATEGFTYDDPNFQTYMTNGVNAGVIMGAYHFARPDNNSATDEANHFVSVAGNFIGNGFLPPVLDFEDPNANTHLDQIYSSQYLTNWVQTWMNRVEALTGVRPVIYLSSHYANFLNASLNVYPLWIAKPGTAPNTPPNDIGNWNDWLFKQYSWNGSVNGISGNVDLDSYHGTTSDFNDMINHLGITDYWQNQFSVYPNPVSDKLFLLYNEQNINIQKVEIFDINGRLLKSQKINEKLLDLSNLQDGLYWIKFWFTNQKTKTFKILKRL